MGSLGSALQDSFGWQAVFYFCGFGALLWVAFVSLYLLRWHKTCSLSTLLPCCSLENNNNNNSSHGSGAMGQSLLPKHSTTTSILHSPSRKLEFSNAKPPESSVPWSLLLTHPAVW